MISFFPELTLKKKIDQSLNIFLEIKDLPDTNKDLLLLHSNFFMFAKKNKNNDNNNISNIIILIFIKHTPRCSFHPVTFSPTSNQDYTNRNLLFNC